MRILNLGNRAVNNWLIPGENGYILIDTGYEKGFRRFQRKLKTNGIRPDEIKTVFSSVPSWAEGLPLKGAGYITKFYLKD